MKLRILVAALSFAIAGLGAAHAACTTASVSGTYGILQTAKSGTGVGVGNGQITFDGLGSATGTNAAFVSYTSSTGWGNSTGAFTGTYTVASNCSGTVTLVDSGSGKKSHYSFVADNNESGSQFIRVDANGSVQLGFLIAQGTVTCGLGTTNRIFAAELSGMVVSTGPVGYVGRLVFSTKGAVTGNLTANVNGTITRSTITGTYTEASDCVGTATITPSGLSTINFTFVVVNSGKELIFVETDTNTVVSGNLQM